MKWRLPPMAASTTMLGMVTVGRPVARGAANTLTAIVPGATGWIAVHGRMLVDGTPEIPGDSVRALRLWRWAGSQWSLLDSLGPRRSGWNRAVYDESRSVLVMPVFEGPDIGVWEWNGERWRKVVADGPSPRHVHALQYDPRRQRVVLVGGQTFERLRSI